MTAVEELTDQQREVLEDKTTFDWTLRVAFVVGGVLFGLLVFAGVMYLICK